MAEKKLQDMTEPELRTLMNEMGRRIVTAARNQNVEKPMFVLLLFNDPALCQYMANCVRADVIKALRETADRLEKSDGGTVERVPFPPIPDSKPPI